jgi:hypothetical protein
VGKRKGNQRHAEFVGLLPEEIAEIARNPRYPSDVRRKAQREEKALRKRNRQKRESGKRG